MCSRADLISKLSPNANFIPPSENIFLLNFKKCFEVYRFVCAGFSAFCDAANNKISFYVGKFFFEAFLVPNKTRSMSRT